jgi:hypothetical protein
MKGATKACAVLQNGARFIPITPSVFYGNYDYKTKI